MIFFTREVPVREDAIFLFFVFASVAEIGPVKVRRDRSLSDSVVKNEGRCRGGL